ncbi:hypothetical protein RJ641_032548, partial [Dillenia turbinata]
MITRSNLAEQLREYQIRSKHDWASVSFFSSTASINSRVDVVVFVIWELAILAFLVFAAVSLYFRHLRLAFVLVCIKLLLLLCMKVAKQVRLDRKKKRRMLLPLSMFCFWFTGICICTRSKLIRHMKQGYARVMGSAIPPMNAAKLSKKGSATEMNNARQPKNKRIPVLSHRGHGLFMLLVYLDSRLSKTGIAYIWNELRQLTMMNVLIMKIDAYQVSICPVATNGKGKQARGNDRICDFHSSPHWHAGR